MADPEASRTRILDAAFAEFAAHGLAGARVDRIAAQARCNKNLLYHYFKSKEKLFETVIDHNTASVERDLPFTPDDLAGYAARACRYALEHPQSMRLVTWYALERGGQPTARSSAMATHAEMIARRQQDGDATTAFPPEFLLAATNALASLWSVANPVSGSRPFTTAQLEAFVAQAVTRIIAP